MIPKTSLDILEFPKLLRFIAGFANSDASKTSVLEIRPLKNREDIEKRLGQISEIRKMIHEGRPLNLSHFSDITELLTRIRPEASVLDAVELAGFIPVLNIITAISYQMRDRLDLPYLKEITENLTGFPDILKALKRSIDSEGNILDSASFLLADLRVQIRKLEARIRKKLEEIMRDERLSVFLQDDFVTTRSGRWVIPVRMDSKGMVPGVVHDLSKSGETAFIEPLTIINLSNELENLVAEQKAEELRILRSLCSMIRKVADEMKEECKTIIYLDLLSCIAKSADVLRMENPRINDSASIHLSGARHPLLELSLKKTGSMQTVVPLDIQLGGDNTVMVITGANAGGKTIAIKTIGLLLLMALSGMPLPAYSSSSLPLIQNLLVDIGDEQSIENNLSTFSAHISNISEILKKKDAKTVILFDELGTGTDPDEGAALACAILRNVRKSGALVFATTHLTDIKGFVHRTEGMVNASMEFDQKTLTPLYKLRFGEPGQSHALEIAKRYGLPDDLIEDAKGMVGQMKVQLDSMIADLNIKRMQYDTALSSLQQQQKESEEKNRQIDRMLLDARKQQQDILAKTYQAAADLISDTKRKMNAFLEEIKKREKAEQKKIIKEVEDAQKMITGKLQELDTDDNRVPDLHDIKKGDSVFISSLGYDAVVIEVNLKSNRVKVMANTMEIEVPVSDMRFQRGKSKPVTKTTRHLDKPDETVSLRLNLIGLRVDEALSQLERFLNHASLADLPEVTIIHGIGKGLLSKAIHDHLTGHPLVKRFRFATQEEGGSAITIVKMH